MGHKEFFLKFDIDSAFRTAVGEMLDAGWILDRREPPEGMPGGPTIYLCHYEAQFLLLTHLIIGGVEIMQSQAAAHGVSHQDACDALGSLMDDLGSRRISLDRDVSNVLSGAAALYLGGTRTYELGIAQGADQFVVIRQIDARSGASLLRPAATHQPGPLTPEQLSDFVIQVMKFDRSNHPERFHGTEPIRFSPRSL